MTEPSLPLPLPWTVGNDATGRVILVLILLFCILLLHRMMTRALPPQRPHRRWPSQPGSAGRPAPVHPGPDRTGPAPSPLDQMLAVAGVPFETVPLLNGEEARLLPVVEEAVQRGGDGHRVMVQIALGELIRPLEGLATAGMRGAALASIRPKRLDFAIIDRSGHLSLAIEFQGSGPSQRDGFMRDAVQREAVRKAGIPYLEVPKGFVPDDIARQVRRFLAPAAPPRAQGLARVSPRSARP